MTTTLNWEANSLSVAELQNRWDRAKRNIEERTGEVTARYRKSTLGSIGKVGVDVPHQDYTMAIKAMQMEVETLEKCVRIASVKLQAPPPKLCCLDLRYWKYVLEIGSYMGAAGSAIAGFKESDPKSAAFISTACSVAGAVSVFFKSRIDDVILRCEKEKALLRAMVAEQSTVIGNAKAIILFVPKIERDTKEIKKRGFSEDGVRRLCATATRVPVPEFRDAYCGFLERELGRDPGSSGLRSIATRYRQGADPASFMADTVESTPMEGAGVGAIVASGPPNQPHVVIDIEGEI